MPSFTRRAGPSSTAPLPGTHPSPSTSLPLLPTGVPSLDDLLGGGLPLGSSLLVLSPDTHSAWGRLLTRYWLAQGLASGHQCCIVGEEDGIRDTVRGCMWVDERTGEGSESEGEGIDGGGGEGRGGGKIAWRYEGMGKFRTSTGRSSGLNLMKTLPNETLAHVNTSGQQTYIDVEPKSSAWETMPTVLSKLQGYLERSEKGKATRLAIHELGGVDWGEPTAHEIHRFLHCLRSLTRMRSAGIIVTMPPHMVSSPPRGWSAGLQEWIKSLAWAVDGCIEMRGFADTPALAPTFAPLHGLLTLHSFPTTHTLLPPTLRHSTLLGVSQSATNERGGGGAGENNLGFRVKRKGLVFETAHLGIEGGSSERRTAPIDDVAAVLDKGLPTISSSTTVQSSELAEGVELVGVVSNAQVEQKPKKPRARVRFGGDDDSNSGAGSHQHPHPSESQRTTVRHDRPDLYEF